MMLGNGEAKKRRQLATRWRDLVTVVMDALLEDVKDQIRERLSWKVVTKSQQQYNGT